jgi:ubiquinone/menaquinone biosynthesis C-methylase UbiE
VSSYDDEIWRLVPEDPGPPPEHLARFVRALGPARRVLDVGCGDGRLTAEIQASDVVAADVSQVALERAARRLPGVPTVLLELDAPLPFDDSEFDLVVCVETLEHVRDVQLLLSEARRVLEPGGRLALTSPAHGRLTGLAVLLGGMERRFDPLSSHLRYFTRRSLAGLLRQMGFDLAAVRRSGGTLLAVASR